MFLEAQLFFEERPCGILKASTKDRHGSRQETRRLRAGPTLLPCRDWPTPVRFIEVRSIVRDRKAIRKETRYFATNIPPEEATPKHLLHLVRSHWGIENRLHYVRDVTFDEDRCSVRTGSAPRTLATVRSLVIAICRACRLNNIAAALRSFAYNPRQAIHVVITPPAPKKK